MLTTANTASFSTASSKSPVKDIGKRHGISSTDNVKDRRNRKGHPDKKVVSSSLSSPAALTPNWIYDLKPGQVDCPCLIHCQRKRLNSQVDSVNANTKQIDGRKLSLDSNILKPKPPSNASQSTVQSAEVTETKEDSKTVTNQKMNKTLTRNIGTQTETYEVKLKPSCFRRKVAIIFK